MDIRRETAGTYEELLNLPGIGEYTAGAIASIGSEKRRQRGRHVFAFTPAVLPMGGTFAIRRSKGVRAFFLP